MLQKIWGTSKEIDRNFNSHHTKVFSKKFGALARNLRGISTLTLQRFESKKYGAIARNLRGFSYLTIQSFYSKKLWTTASKLRGMTTLTMQRFSAKNFRLLQGNLEESLLSLYRGLKAENMGH